MRTTKLIATGCLALFFAACASETTSSGGSGGKQTTTSGSTTSGSTTSGSTTSGSTTSGSTTSGSTTSGSTTSGSTTSGAATCTVGTTAVVGPTANATCNGAFTLGTYTGYFFTFSDAADGGGSKISPDCTSLGCTPKITTGMCTCGVAGKVQGTAYATYWGAGVGLNLGQTVSSTCTGGDALPVDLTGKTIKATIDNPPAALRLKLDTADGDNFCLDVSAKAGNINVPVADIVSECWTGGAGTPIPAAKMAAVKAIQFQVPTGGTDVSFNFCITALSIE